MARPCVPPTSMESFSVESCNLSIIPENLLNWNNLKEFGLGNNPFICNCSLAWLINDILSPTHSTNLKSFIPEKNQGSNGFKCYGPLPLKNVPFSHISHKLCPKSFSYFTLFFVGAAFIFVFILGIIVAPFIRRFYRSKIQKSGFTNHNFTDEKILEDFDEESNCQ